MQIKTIGDLKEALEGIPTDVLKDFGVHYGEEPFVQLLYFGDVETDPQEEFQKRIGQYPILSNIDEWVQNISKLTLKQERNAEIEDIDSAEDISDCISSEDKIDLPEYQKK